MAVQRQKKREGGGSSLDLQSIKLLVHMIAFIVFYVRRREEKRREEKICLIYTSSFFFWILFDSNKSFAVKHEWKKRKRGKSIIDYIQYMDT